MNASEHVQATVAEIRASGRADLEQAESLVEVAFDLQKKPKSPQDLIDALFLYDQALALATDTPLARARALAGRGGALRRMPGYGSEQLVEAKGCFQEALTVLREAGDPEETAEVEMSYGLVTQALASFGEARLEDAVQAYHRALNTFTRDKYPREFATIHNNLATAYLSMRLSPEREVIREALAVQSFQEALKVVTLDEDPTEYAMLQNNLGNALQAMRSSHPVENLVRAVEAYDEALKVRTEYDTPIEYANTVANKANALMNLPDPDINAQNGSATPEDGVNTAPPGELGGAPAPAAAPTAQVGNPQNLLEAIRLLREAGTVFSKNGVMDRAAMVNELADGLAAELGQVEA